MSGEVLAFPQAPDGVEVRHLRAFVAVAEELNFNRAATRLYLSQPALSRQIRALERLLGCELLRRSTHSVELTIAGSALLDRARRLLADLDEAIATTQSVGGELANRMATMWAPVLEVITADRDIQETRIAYEAFLAQSAVPESIHVRPVNAGGVSSLALGAADQLETPILYLHGGGYAVGSAYGYRPLVGALATAAGAGALVPDYRLAPEHPFPAAVEDALTTYRWLAEQCAGIVLAADSAGAGLACSLMLTLRAQRLPLPAGAVFLCPGVDPTGQSILASIAGLGGGLEGQALLRRLPGRTPRGRPGRQPARRRSHRPAADADPDRDGGHRAGRVAPARRARTRARRRRQHRGLRRRHARLPRLLALPAGGGGRAPAGRHVHPHATRGR